MVPLKRINKLHVLIGTSLGLGFCPVAPGTAGALGGLLIGLLITNYSANPAILLAVLILVFFYLGIRSSSYLERSWGNDPSKVVIDEVVGMWIAMFMIPSGQIYSLAAFILFRLFDIYKPLYIRKLEKLKGGLGIMMDDVLAGIYANLIVQLLFYLKIFIYG